MTETQATPPAESSGEDEDMRGLRVGIFGPRQKKGKGWPGEAEKHRQAALKGWAHKRKPASPRAPYQSREYRGLAPIGSRESRGLPPRVYPGMTIDEKRERHNAYERSRYTRKKSKKVTLEQLDKRAAQARARRAAKRAAK